MKRNWLWTAVLGASLVTATTACQKDAPAPAGGSGTASAGSAGPATGTAASGDSLQDLSNRVKALEDEAAKNRDALAFLNQVYAQQKAQQEEQEAQEPAPDAIFAVDITGDQIDGPTTAMVTIIEAWDFA